MTQHSNPHPEPARALAPPTDQDGASADQAPGGAGPDANGGTGLSATDLRRRVTDLTNGMAPHMTAATEKTRAVAEKTVASGGNAAREAGQQARRHPRATGGVAAGAMVLLLLRRGMRRRGRAKS